MLHHCERLADNTSGGIHVDQGARAGAHQELWHLGEVRVQSRYLRNVP